MIAAELKEFVEIVEAGSVSEAARNLGMPRATLSRHLSALEDDLGVTLLHRETRRLVLTQAGEQLFRKALKIVSDIEETEIAVKNLDGVPRGLLRVSIPPAMGDLAVDLVARFLGDHAEVSVDLVTSIRHVDLVGEGIDVALRGGVVRDPSLMARRVMTSPAILVASPELLERTGPIESLADLKKLPCIGVFEGGWKPVDEYPLFDGGAVEIEGRLRCNDILLLRRFVRSGIAAALLPHEFVRRPLDDGAFVHVLPEIVGFTGSVNIVWPQQDHLDPKVRAFIDAAVQMFEEWSPRPWEPE